MTEKSIEQKADEAAVASPVGATPPKTVELSNGIVLKTKPIPPLAIRQAVIAFGPPPNPPVIHLEDKDRDEENPNDPDYQKTLAEHTEAVAMVAYKVIIVLGTEPLHIPDDMEGPEAEKWLDDLEFLGIEVDRDNSRARYLAWLQWYAITSNEDLQLVMAGPGQAVGITEEEVAISVDSFQNRATRRVTNKRKTKGRN